MPLESALFRIFHLRFLRKVRNVFEVEGRFRTQSIFTFNYDSPEDLP